MEVLRQYSNVRHCWAMRKVEIMEIKSSPPGAEKKHVF